ncbi:MAG TPA: C13 family peptidase [Steroidobacter sp.]|uniref:C13 family peptidase n=1 Tax=Steroidobacter sp. TaxID=1978227 RepID=UPI002ED85ACE
MTSDAAAVPRPGSSWLEWIRQGLRACTLRTVQRLPEGPGAWPMLLIVAAAAAIVIGVERFEVGPATFDARAWLLSWSTSGFLIFGHWLVFSWARDKATHASPVAAWYLLFTIAAVPMGLFGTAVRAYNPEWWKMAGWVAWTFYAALWVWLVLAMWRISRAVTRSAVVVMSLIVYALVVQILGSWVLSTQVWEPVESYEEDEYASLELSQEMFEAQQVLLKDSLQAIVPSAGDERQTYGLIYAPYDEEVFLRESAMVKQVLEERFGARGRVVRLVNNVKTGNELPWATTLNLERSLQALAEAMNPERDVLVLYLTSHGGADFKLAAENWPLEVEDLTAAELRSMLDDLGIRHRVIAVSACYSGGWIEPLQNDDTLIMTAADRDHTSYGCGSKSELTYFGRAVFDEQLRKTLSFEEAFKAAVPVIKQREIDGKKDDGFSNPQISVGSNIRGVLEELTAN